MKLILAHSLGMCFGVRDALRHAADVESPQQTTIYGELVHNEVVLHQLESRGFRQTAERDRRELPMTDAVLITAHGISDRSRLRLLDAGKQLIDTTCPLVRRVHDAARQLERDGYHVLVLGKAGHVEVQGIVEDLRSYDVVGSADQVRTYPCARLGIVCQTTLPPHVADELCGQIEAANPQAEIAAWTPSASRLAAGSRQCASCCHRSRRWW
jgi:4-hydroxy-3-methylbut-2-enyl diphosphate reductase